MKQPALLLALCGLCTALPAQQGPTITTATDYGVLASEGQNSDQDAVAIRTTIQRGLQIQAQVGHDCNSAQAATFVSRASDPQFGEGICLREVGGVESHNTTPTAAGTSDSPPGARHPAFAAHGLELVYAVNQGSTGKVKISFRGDASGGAGGGMAIDVDGDGQPDFSARANGQPQGAEIPVTAGSHGVILRIMTEGQAARTSSGREGYDFHLCVYFREDPSGPRCHFTPFGNDCGLHIEGDLLPNPQGGHFVKLDITGGRPFARGAIIIANRLAAPMPLPYSQCDLLLDPLGIIGPIQMNLCGRELLMIPVHLHCVVISFQAITFNMRCQQFTIDASGGIEFRCCP